MLRSLMAFIGLFASLQSVAQFQVRSAEELIAPGDSGWIMVNNWIKTSTNKVEVLPCDSSNALNELYHVQVTSRSPMGAVIYKTGGILVDHGWIRILGSGSARMSRSIAEWNKGKTFQEYGEHTPYYLVADDVLGGLFAINGGSLGDDVGIVYYLSPDNLKWASTNYSYSQFLMFCFTGRIDKFFEGFRWVGWQKNLDSLSGDVGFICTPPLWTKEGIDLRKDTLKAIDMNDLYLKMMNARKALGLDAKSK